MIQAKKIYSDSELQSQIWSSVNKMDHEQKVKLMDFINSFNINDNNKHHELLKYAGIFDNDELEIITNSIKDCEKIDLNEW